MSLRTRTAAWPLATLLAAAASCGHSAAKTPAAEHPVTSPVAQTGTVHAAAETRDPPKTRKQPGPAPSTASIGTVMAEHFIVTSWARDAVISGQLEPLRGPLLLLAEHRYESVEPGGWLPWIAQLQAAAWLTAHAENLDAAAIGVATMSRVCGECHVATGGGPHYAVAPTQVFEPYRESFPERMGRHMWAADQLWRGLTTPSDASWNAGAAALRDAPAEMDAWLPEAFAEDLTAVRELGKDAEAADQIAERADVYGLLLATCADCHHRFIEHGL